MKLIKKLEEEKGGFCLVVSQSSETWQHSWLGGEEYVVSQAAVQTDSNISNFFLFKFTNSKSIINSYWNNECWKKIEKELKLINFEGRLDLQNLVSDEQTRNNESNVIRNAIDLHKTFSTLKLIATSSSVTKQRLRFELLARLWVLFLFQFIFSGGA